MGIGAAVAARLFDQTAAGHRVYPVTLPQNVAYPAITFQQISQTPTHLMGGDSAVVRARIQVDSWGKTYAEVQSLATEVTALLNRFAGDLAGFTVHDVMLDNAMDLYDSDSNSRRVMQDYAIFFTIN